MDAVDVAGFLEFDCIVLRDELLESSEAIQRVVAEKWAFAEESVGKSRSRCREEASDVGVKVEGEVVYLNVDGEEDQDVDVEGDETTSVTQPPQSIQSRGIDSVVENISPTEVPGATEPKERKRLYSPKCSEGAAECSSSLSPPPTCSLCLRQFSSEADRANHVCVVTSEAQRSHQSYPHRGEAFAGATSSSSSDVRQEPKGATDEHGEPPKCQIPSDDCDGVLRPEDSGSTLVTAASGVGSSHENTFGGSLPALSKAGASALSDSTDDARVNLWKCAVGVCGICGKIFNNNSNLKRHAHVHGSGIFLVCDVCGMFFPDRCSLWRHKEQHPRKIRAKLYKCNICGKCVNSLNSLRKHRTQHEQAYVCEVCGESFHRASGLQIHKYLHVR